MSTVSQRSFAGGEISPSLHARVDVVKYTTGLKTCRNFYVKRSGGVDSRPGTEFICEVKDSTKRVRLVEFVFNSDQTYVLEFGDFYVRFIRNGVQIEVSGVAAYSAVTTYALGDLVVDGGINYYSKVSSNLANTPATSPTQWYALVGDIFEIPSPYSAAEAQAINFVQSADVVVITHQSHPVYELRRTAHTGWTLPQVTFRPSIEPPTNLAVSGGAGTVAYWVVTSIKADTFEESLPTDEIGASSDGSGGSPKTLTWNAVDGAGEYNIYKKINGVYGFVGVAGGTSFADEGIEPDSTDTPPKSANPFAVTPIETSSIGAAGTGYVVGNILTVVQSGGSNGKIYVDSIGGGGSVATYHIYDNGSGYSVANGLSTTGGSGTGFTLNITKVSTLNFPATAGYYQQRLGFANTLAKPEFCILSKTGFFRNLTKSAPLQDDDAVEFTMTGRRVNQVRQLVDIGSLILLTSEAEWLAQGDAAGIIRPGEINLKTQSYNGSSTLRPILINDNALYLQARGTVVRDLFATIEATGNIGYKGTDLTIFADHLFTLYSISDWAYCQTPNSLVWAVRSDGALLGFTYLREHQIWAWHRHDTDGLFENVASIPEGIEDFPYFVVNRTINGTTKRYIERMVTRKIDNIVDFLGMDCSLSFDGRNTGATTMTLTGSGWAYTDTLVLTASVSFFVIGDIGNQIQITGPDGTFIRCTIVGYTSGTVVAVKPNKNVPVSMQAVPLTTWAKAVDNLSGLGHLEGKEVSVFGDGFVVASPNNRNIENVLTVTAGSIALDKPYAVIHVGLPFLPDVETLNIDTAQGETLVDKKKIVSNVTLFVEKTRGVWVGARPPSDDNDNPLEGLEEYKARNDENYDDPVALRSGEIEIKNRPEWNSNGRVFIRQVDPLPLTLLAVMPAGMFPFTRGA